MLELHFGSWVVFFFQAEDGIRDLVRSRGLGDVYKRQAAGPHTQLAVNIIAAWLCGARYIELKTIQTLDEPVSYTHPDAADERSSVDLGGRRIIKKKKH